MKDECLLKNADKHHTAEGSPTVAAGFDLKSGYNPEPFVGVPIILIVHIDHKKTRYWSKL